MYIYDIKGFFRVSQFFAISKCSEGGALIFVLVFQIEDLHKIYLCFIKVLWKFKR